jgi:hypothetical protein
MESEIEKRGPGRPRRDGAEIRSEIRADGIRGKTRKRKGGQLADKYHVDAASIPEGMSYEWKTVSVFGKEDHTYSVMLREQGWDPVDAERHPDMVSPDHKGPIVRDGLMLMERPIELTREAQAEDRAAAREVIQTKRQQMGEAPAGTAPREHPNLQNYIRTSYESMPIDG